MLQKHPQKFYLNLFYETYLKNKKYLTVCTARAGNVIGGGDWSEKD